MEQIKNFFSWLRRWISPVYVAMLVAAFILWFITKLGGTYTTDHDVTVVIDNVEYSVDCTIKGKGIDLLLQAKAVTGLPIVTEIMNISTLDLFTDIDIIQVGARNMQNFDLLKELGKTQKPILLKRGLANTLQELLMSAEYIMSEGNENVILCERGIRTFETATRNTLDLAAVSVLHDLSHLPIIVDPSHATGKSKLVPPMALAATAAGCDGLIIEVHNNPACALCDGAQSLTPAQFDTLSNRVRKIREAIA